jgi:hypothetical protein
MNHVDHTVHAVRCVLFSTANRAYSNAVHSRRKRARSVEQDKPNRVNSVNCVSKSGRRQSPSVFPSLGGVEIHQW